MARQRALAWIGTVPPGASTTEMGRLRWILDRSRGTQVLAVPCERDPLWIIDYLRSLADNQGEVFDAYVPGDYRDYRSFRVHRLRPRARLEPRHVALGHTGSVPSALTKLKALRVRAGHPRVPLQVSWPAPLDRALFAFAPSAIDPRGRARTWAAALRRPARLSRVLKYLHTFTAADHAEFTELVGAHGEDLVLQLESPAILLLLWAAPRWLRPVAADRIARHVAGVIASVPSTARLVLHLCYGNLRDQHLHAPGSLADHVLFLNRLAHHLGARDRQLPTVHIPAAYGPHPPPTHPAFYDPLQHLNSRYDLIAGVVDEHEPITSAAALTRFESAAGRQAVAVATTCGLGRHTNRDADLAALVMRALTDPATTPATLTSALMDTLAIERLASSRGLGHVRVVHTPSEPSPSASGQATSATPATDPTTDTPGTADRPVGHKAPATSSRHVTANAAVPPVPPPDTPDHCRDLRGGTPS